MQSQHKSCLGEICYLICHLQQIIIKSKNKTSDLNLDHENNTRMKYNYEVDDLILLDCGTLQRKLVPKRNGPSQVIRVYSNGILKIRMGIYVQRVSIGQCIPYFKSINEAKCDDLALMRTACE
jgi:hypothetical protein